MLIPQTEEYVGPGQADPNKSRAEREQELRNLSRTPLGLEVIRYYFSRYTSVLKVRNYPVDLPMIETILRYEYPDE